MTLKLSPGTFYGTRSRSRFISGIRLTESLYSPSFRIPTHSHESAYFGLILEGSYTETYEAKTRQCKPSMVLFHPAEEIHSERHDDVTVRILSIEFPMQWRDRLPGRSLALQAPGCFSSGSVVRLANRLYEEFQSQDALAPLAIEGLMLEILAESCRLQLHAGESRAPRWLQQAQDLLHDQFAENLTLASIARTVGVHPAHLCRAFRQHYHCTLGDYVRDLRIERARHDLISSDTPLIEIALAAGYSDQSHFTTAFKRQAGITPTQFRKLFQKR